MLEDEDLTEVFRLFTSPYTWYTEVAMAYKTLGDDWISRYIIKLWTEVSERIKRNALK